MNQRKKAFTLIELLVVMDVDKTLTAVYIGTDLGGDCQGGAVALI